MKFEDYHPLINFIFFFCVISLSLIFNHPVYIAIAYITSFIYSVYLNGYKGLIFNIVAIIFAVVFPFYYASYNHFGITPVYVNFIDNTITVESFIYGVILAVKFLSALQWCSCMNKIFTTDKVGYLFGKVSPTLSLYFSIILRTVPQIKIKIKKMKEGQTSLGNGCKKGEIFKNTRKWIRYLSVIVSYIIDNFFEKSFSMKSRGYNLKGKTHFSIYRFNNSDRIFVLSIFTMLTILSVAYAFEQTYIIYDPEIIIKPFTTGSMFFTTIYTFFCLMPMATEAKYKYFFYKN